MADLVGKFGGRGLVRGEIEKGTLIRLAGETFIYGRSTKGGLIIMHDEQVDEIRSQRGQNR